MAEFAPVLPARLYPWLDMPGPDSVHFVHAPQVEGVPELCKWLLHACTDSKVILDCFAWELDGDQPDIDCVLRVAEQLQYLDLTIIVPDVIRDSKASISMLGRCGLKLGCYGNLMIVPHGHDLVEWVSCAKRMLHLISAWATGVMIGIPKYVSEFHHELDILPRWVAAAWVAGYAPGYQVHLLGAGVGLAEVMRVARLPNVVSCDSTSPFTAAVEGRLWERNCMPKFEMLPAWWGLVAPSSIGLHTMTPQVMHMAELNIAIWKGRLAYG